MPLPQSVRSAIPLVIGLAVGVFGATLFQQSLPEEAGSTEERALKLEVELKTAKNRIAALESSDPSGGRPQRTLSDGIRGIAERLRSGEAVSPDDIFEATQPLLRDLAPLLDRVRVLEERERIDSKVGELAREYDLTPAQQESLQKWFEQKVERDAKAYNDLLMKDGTRFEDLMRASTDVRPDEGLEDFMPAILSGEKLAAFKTKRLAERAERVTAEADRQVERLDAIVSLDDAQRDQIFAITARASKEYDPAMQIEGTAGAMGGAAAGNRKDAVLAVLRPDQRQAYEVDQASRRKEAQERMAALGLTLPDDWEALDFADFD